MIEEFAGQPVELGRNVAAFVVIAMNLPTKANDESRNLLVVTFDRKAKARAGLDHVLAGTNQAKSCSHLSSS